MYTASELFPSASSTAIAVPAKAQSSWDAQTAITSSKTLASSCSVIVLASAGVHVVPYSKPYASPSASAVVTVALFAV